MSDSSKQPSRLARLRAELQDQERCARRHAERTEDAQLAADRLRVEIDREELKTGAR